MAFFCRLSSNAQLRNTRGAPRDDRSRSSDSNFSCCCNSRVEIRSRATAAAAPAVQAKTRTNWSSESFVCMGAATVVASLQENCCSVITSPSSSSSTCDIFEKKEQKCKSIALPRMKSSRGGPIIMIPLLLLPLMLIASTLSCNCLVVRLPPNNRHNLTSSFVMEGRSLDDATKQHHPPINVHQQQEQEGRAAAHWSLPNRPSLFSIIRFPNEECFDSSNQSGTCYTAFECKLLGGQPSSPCAAGFGSCCIVSRTCHVTTREKVVYFKNPSYPSADSDEKFCDLTVEMSDINVCQLRLDFLDFQLDPPTHGACKDDYMEISASGMPPQTVPRLCGMNRNQHLYINLPQDLSERSASIVFYTDPVGDHRWQVKVTQIDCNQYRPLDWKRQYAKFATSPLWNAHPVSNGGLRLPSALAGGKYSTTFASGFQTMSQTASALAYEFLKPQFTPRAPMGCLQYFTQVSGIIESFNFGQYLNNMDYSICIQRQPDTCRVVFTSSDYDWSLNGVGIAGSSSGVGDQDCARDYLLIPGASRTGDGFTYDRYCGGRLNYYRGQSLSSPVVMKTSGPIVLRFHSDAHFETVNNGGFRLQYDQSTQDCIYHTAEEAGSLSSQQLLASTLSDSRPYVSPLIQDAPALYASQQLSPSVIIQHPQVQSSNNNNQQYVDMTAADDFHYSPTSSAQHVSGSSDHELLKPLVNLSNNRSTGTGTTSSTGGESNNSLKRRQDDDNNDEQGRGDGDDDDRLFSRMDNKRFRGQRRRPPPFASSTTDRVNQLLLTDLSKAFQLITTRNSRALKML